MKAGTPSRAAAGHLRQLGVALAAFYLAFVGWFLAVALVPAVVGYAPYLIMTGSMAPRIQPGSVVVAAPYDGTVDLGEGTVVVYRDGERTVTHRIVEVLTDGRAVTGYVTRGDANPTADTAPVEPDNVIGVGRLLAPFVGLPVVWAARGAWVTLGIWAALTPLACHLVWRAWTAPENSAPRQRRRTRRARRPSVAVALAGMLLVTSGGQALPVAEAGFAATTSNPDARWSAAAAFPGDFAAVTASGLPANAASASQTFTFTLVGGLVPGATVGIDLTEPHRGPVSYLQAAQPSASVGTAALVLTQGNSAMRTAALVYTAPAGGVADGATVTITIPSGIRTNQAAAGLNVPFVRDDTGVSRTATFDVM